MNKALVAACLVVAALCATVARASEWSYFSMLGNSVSVSYLSVDSTTYTWKFRNDGYNRIKYLKFQVSYIDATTGRFVTDSDVFPGSLRAGETFGGWTAFTANTRSQPSIRVLEIDRD